MNKFVNRQLYQRTWAVSYAGKINLQQATDNSIIEQHKTQANFMLVVIKKRKYQPDLDNWVTIDKQVLVMGNKRNRINPKTLVTLQNSKTWSTIGDGVVETIFEDATQLSYISDEKALELYILK
jgi:hypothetical protein